MTVEYRIVRQRVGAENTCTVIAWGHSQSVELIRQNTPMSAVLNDPCVHDSDYEYVLQVYVTAGNHCHGWWGIRTLRADSWTDVSSQQISLSACLISSDIPLVEDETPTFTSADIPLTGADLELLQHVAPAVTHI